MKTILLFGAGKSATVLIEYLLEESVRYKWHVIVADANKSVVELKTRNHPNAEAAGLDITNNSARGSFIQKADIVISMMPPSLHLLVAKDCLQYGKHLLTASYADEEILKLKEEAEKKNILFLCEMGLDPGIDHMSAMQLLNKLKRKGAEITSFKSHCGGLVAAESDDNPWHYKISWNPRNVVLAGKAGAIYREDGETMQEAYEELFKPERMVKGNGPEEMFSYYPNRNSLPYIDLYNLHDTRTFVRTTLRHPDFMYGWKNVVQLKLTDETQSYNTDGMSLCSFFKEHFEINGFGQWLQQKLSDSFTETKSMLDNLMKMMEAEIEAEKTGEAMPEQLMVVDETGDLKQIEIDEVKEKAATTVALKMHEANLIMKQLFFLGMDDEETIINKGICSAADILQFILEKKLVLKNTDKDRIVMLHEIEYLLEGKDHKVTSYLSVTGRDSVHTAMAKTVGLPLGIAAKMILNNEIHLKGIHVPVIPEIYDPVLKELNERGISFIEMDIQD